MDARRANASGCIVIGLDSLIDGAYALAYICTSEQQLVCLSALLVVTRVGGTR